MYIYLPAGLLAVGLYQIFECPFEKHVAEESLILFQQYVDQLGLYQALVSSQAPSVY